jgi:hypothetical protein
MYAAASLRYQLLTLRRLDRIVEAGGTRPLNTSSQILPHLLQSLCFADSEAMNEASSPHLIIYEKRQVRFWHPHSCQLNGT